MGVITEEEEEEEAVKLAAAAAAEAAAAEEVDPLLLLVFLLFSCRPFQDWIWTRGGLWWTFCFVASVVSSATSFWNRAPFLAASLVEIAQFLALPPKGLGRTVADSSFILILATSRDLSSVATTKPLRRRLNFGTFFRIPWTQGSAFMAKQSHSRFSFEIMFSFFGREFFRTLRWPIM